MDDNRHDPRRANARHDDPRQDDLTSDERHDSASDEDLAPLSGADAGNAFAPLPIDWPDLAEEIREEFIFEREPDALEEPRLREFLQLCLRFGYMEKRIQGEILCEIPAHVSLLRGDEHRELMEEAEALAERERQNLGLEPGPIESVHEIFDELGIKIVEIAPGNGVTSGAFVFNNDTGPALLSVAVPNSPIARFILAHEYCHLLADVDPYHNRFCSHGENGCTGAGYGGRLMDAADGIDPTALGATSGTSEEELHRAELRADLFARNLLIPRTHFVSSLRQFGQGKRGEFDLERLSHMAYYYGVTTPMIINRLADLDLITADDARRMRADVQAVLPQGLDTDPIGISSTTTLNVGHGESDDRIQATVSQRFIHLGLALYLNGQVSRKQLSTLLYTHGPAMTRLLQWVDSAKETAQRAREAEEQAGAGEGHESE